MMHCNGSEQRLYAVISCPCMLDIVELFCDVLGTNNIQSADQLRTSHFYSNLTYYSLIDQSYRHKQGMTIEGCSASCFHL